MTICAGVASLDQFLTALKRFNDAGVINTLGVIATFTVAFLALAPSIWKRIKRPKLAVLLKPVKVDNIPGSQPTTIRAQGVVQQPLPQITTSAGMLIQNKGASAALSVRCVVTDLYVSTGELSFQWRDHPPQETLSASDLPAGLPLAVPLIGRKQIGDVDTGFLFGKVPEIAIASTGAGNVRFTSTKTISSALGPPLPAGTYIVRIVVSANNAAPTTHLIRIQLTNGTQLRFAKWRERWAIRKADRVAIKGQISRGG
jgi:hypothetical protein